jgi:hypothetical protein
MSESPTVRRAAATCVGERMLALIRRGVCVIFQFERPRPALRPDPEELLATRFAEHFSLEL